MRRKMFRIGYIRRQTLLSISLLLLLPIMCHAFAQTKSKGSGTSSRAPRRHHRNKRPSGPPNTSSDRWRRAEQVESLMLIALESMQSASQSPPSHSSAWPFVPDFPPIRDCNEALACFGDGGDFLRSLRLFLKMRKAVFLAQSTRNNQSVLVWTVPAPSLVTYSTLMSRAVQVGKAAVALRLWNLMKLQSEFFLSPKRQQDSTSVLTPDVKAANILMNVYAKLANVESAQDLMQQMRFGNGTDVPKLSPNLVTYNTLLNAAQKAGELDAALEAKALLEASGLSPDARTYTSLISTVSRKASETSGANDPSLAFELLHEMTTVHSIRPNAMTYSALIDACGRCGRPDLALQGLRTMLRQKANEQEEKEMRMGTNATDYYFPNEVGAWTAAIDACGKAGRIETALRLFKAMSTNFGVNPNTITCGCLMDCLLRNGYTAEALDLLRYMEQHAISPSEVMYTSLMTSAGRLAQVENKRSLRNENKDEIEIGSSGTKAIEVYTELMRSLMQEKRPLAKQQQQNDRQELTLTKVFLVFQEMKAVGAEPDLASFNTLLRACARARDRNRALQVLSWIRAAGYTPNDTSWRELIRAAGSQSELAEETWDTALSYHGDDEVEWRPSVATLGALASSYLRHARSLQDPAQRRDLYLKVIELYEQVLTRDERRGLHWIPLDRLHENARVMLLILQAVVALREDATFEVEKHKHLHSLTESIVELDCLKEESATKPNRPGLMALQTAKRWLHVDSAAAAVAAKQS